MNKVLVSNNNLLDSYFSDNNFYLFELNDITKNINIDINNRNEIIIIGNNINININIKQSADSFLKLSLFCKDSNITINNDLYKRSIFNLNNSIFTNINSLNKIIVNHKEDNSESFVKNHGFVNSNSILTFDIEGKIIKDASNCSCIQDNMIIESKNGKGTILPILLIDNYDVDAKHSAYVGEFKEKDLFYLTSRGISLKDAKSLLLNAFLVGYLDIDEEYKSRFMNTIIAYSKEVNYE